MFATILAIISTTITALTVVPEIKSSLNKFIDAAKNYYPNDLTFEVKDNQWTVNRPEPFIVEVPEKLREEANKTKNTQDTTQEKLPKNFIVFSHTGTIDDFNKLDTLMLVNATNILIKDNNGFKVYPLEKMPNGKLDKTLFVQSIDKLKGITSAIPYVATAFILLFQILRYFFLGAMYLLTTSAIVWLFGKATQLKPTFGEAARVTIHAATLPFTLEIILGLIRQTLPIPMWFTLLNVIMAVVVMNKVSREKTEEVITPQVIK